LGLKFDTFPPHSYSSSPLKSDHFGIEMKITGTTNTGLKALKSDHFGIEMENPHRGLSPYSFTKIRPFWD